jgi:hypothetical protein
LKKQTQFQNEQFGATFSMTMEYGKRVHFVGSKKQTQSDVVFDYTGTSF